MRETILSVLLTIAAVMPLWAEDGSRLWLRMESVSGTDAGAVAGGGTLAIARDELKRYWAGPAVQLVKDSTVGAGGAFCILSRRGADGFVNSITVSSASDTGLLYGVYELLRCWQTSGDVRDGIRKPAFGLRILDHWDNPDGSIERGYAGKSIWKWDLIDGDTYNIDDSLRIRIEAYARANASIGINGVVLNNVNASPKMLTEEYIRKVAVIADVLRPYGVRVYLSVNFAAPKAIGGLPTADPADRSVAMWWAGKARELYEAIPDFGGFLVKANSEGQPGPGDYGRTHAEGANMLAAALRPYGGVVMWRCFVYGNHKGEDRVMQAVSEFAPLDGQFAPNVILQAKNGPLDFQPREPYAPVFDRITRTPLMAELQITQEYLGQSRHLVYLAPMWTEFFSFVSPSRLVGVAGVANVGDDANWCGHHFSQANWYAFGRLAWNPSLSADSIAREWLVQTFTPDRRFVEPMAKIMGGSREDCVDYMMPLGLHHIFKAGHHYGPEPGGNQAHFPEEWRPVYYHKADSTGIGFDRTMAGSGAVGQYRHPYDSVYGGLDTCPEEYMLWFHHVPWTHIMRSGRTLWQELCFRYNRGVMAVEGYVSTWQAMAPYVDRRRHTEVADRLDTQLRDAREWRDVCLEYFGHFAVGAGCCSNWQSVRNR